MKARRLLAMFLCVALSVSMLPVMQKKAQADIGTVRYEAEEGQVPETAQIGTPDWESPFSGNKYVENLNGETLEEATAVTFTVQAEAAGKYTLGIGYSTTENTATAFSVNGEEWITVSLASTGDWTAVREAYAEVSLNKGENTIQVKGAIDGKWIILDYITVESTNGMLVKTAVDLVNNGNIKMVGRSATVGTAKAFDWTASGFEFVYTGEGTIKANITASKGASNNYAELEISVDGVKSRTTVYGTQDVTLAANLSAGEHIIKVNKANEAGFGLAELNNMKYPEGGSLKATATKDVKFEFVGDSVTCGNQINPTTGAEDGMGSYAYLMSQKFNAETNIISVSGRGLMAGWEQENGWALGRNAEMNTIYEYTSYFRDKATKWDKKSYTPDVIIVNLGNNDLGPATGVTASEYCSEAVKFSNKLRADYPNAYILWVYGIFVNRNYSEEIASAIAGIGDTNIEFLYMNQYNGGVQDHPSYAQHKTITDILSKKVSEKTGLEYGGNKPEVIPNAEGRHEAEAAASFEQGSASGTYTIQTDANYSGGQAVGGMDTWPDNGRAYCTTYVNAEKAGTYEMTIGYAGGEANHPCNIDVRLNGGEWVSALAQPTSDWNVTGTVKLNIELKKGTNTIDVTGASNIYYEDMGWEWLNIDYFDLKLADETVTTEPETTTKTEVTTPEKTTEETTKDTSGETTKDTSGETTKDTSVETTTENITTTETTTASEAVTTPKQNVTTVSAKVKAPAKAKIRKVSIKKFAASRVKLSLKKVKRAKGYQIAVYKTKKTAKKNKKALVRKFVKKVKVNLKSKKLKNKKHLFVKARAYALDRKGAKFYGKWSKIKNIKIKK